MSIPRARYTQLALPPYSYVPGHAPHPLSDSAGHMFGDTPAVASALLPAAWHASTEYRYGIDLFNHGFYWEAHEAWESLWHAAGRKGQIADFLKGLIKLAAAGVKVREGNPRGVRRHALRASELLAGIVDPEFCGLAIDRLRAIAERLADTADLYSQPQPQLQLEITLVLSES